MAIVIVLFAVIQNRRSAREIAGNYHAATFDLVERPICLVVGFDRTVSFGRYGTSIAVEAAISPGTIVRLKITRQPFGTIDGIPLDEFIVGFTYDVGTMLACYLLAERFAKPVADESPESVLPVRSQIRFARAFPVQGKVVPIHETQFHTGPAELTEAADRPPRRRKQR